MKKLLLSALAILFVTGAFSNLKAAARSVSYRGTDYVLSEEALARWSCGLYADHAEYKVRVFDLPDTGLEVDHYMAFVGYQLLPWLTPYVSGGSSDATFDGEDDSDVCFGVGAQFNLLNHEIPDPTLLEDRLILNGGLEYTFNSAEWMDETLDFGEFTAQLNAGIVNDVTGEAFFIPESVTLFGGPIYKSINSSDIKGSGASGLGIGGGAEILYTERVSLYGYWFKTDESGYAFGLNVRF